MNNILEDRLVECGVKANDILTYIEKKDLGVKGVFIYTSHIEGLGTKSSDLDVYVISEKVDFQDNMKVENDVYIENIIINNTIIDIEYREKPTLIKSIERVNDFKVNIDVNEIKFIDKINKSIVLYNNTYCSQIKELINQETILKRVKQYYMSEANSYFGDAIKLFKNKEYLSALFCARNALEFALGILNAKKGYSNVKNKWISKIFFLSENEGSELIESYLNLQVYPNIREEDLESHIEDLLEFTQRVISMGIIRDV